MSSSRPWYRAGRGWYVSMGGQQIPLGIPDPNDEAAAWKAFQDVVAKLRGDPTGADSRTVAAAVEAFLSERAATVGEPCARRYRQYLKRLARFGAVKLSEVDPAAIDMDFRKARWSPTTLNKALSTVEMLLRWAGRPHRFKKPPTQSAGAKSVIPPEVHAMILCVAIGDWRQLIRFLWCTGCRPQEAAGLEVSDVDFSAGIATIREHKTARLGKSRMLYLSPEALEILTKQRDKYHRGLLFRGMRGRRFSRQAFVMRFTRLSERIGHHVTAYGYRHTYATRALESGLFTEAQIAAILGHATTAMLFKHYSHLTSNTRLLRELTAKLA